MAAPLKLGLIGNGIRRTRSHHLHRMLGEMIGRETTYRLMDLSEVPHPPPIAEQLNECARQGFRGVNITHPYKREAFQAVTPAASMPKGLRSVNTVVFESGAHQGDNTDHTGFHRAFQAAFGGTVRPGRVLQLGAGGVGVALAFALAKLGAVEIVIGDTEPARTLDLVDCLAASGFNARPAGDDITGEMLACDGLVNATPLGMYQYPGNPFPVAGLKGRSWAFDAVYTPENTEFMRLCAANNIETMSGFLLFVYQGLDAFERFSGVSVDASAVLRRLGDHDLHGD